MNSKRLKILALNWRDPKHSEAGGAELHLDHILSYLAQKHEVVLISTKVHAYEEEFVYNGYQVLRIGHPFLFNFTFKQIWNSKLKDIGFDIIIDDISKIGLQTPKYIKNIPIISIFHHLHGHTLFHLLPLPLALYVFVMERMALKVYVDTPIVAVSQSTKNELLQLACFSKIHVLPNGIEDNYFSLQKTEKIPFQLCSVSRLTKAKQIDHSLQIFSKLIVEFPQAQFFIAGKGPEEKQLKKFAEKLGISYAVHFLGFVSEQQKIDLLRSSMGLLFTSQKEGWGITAIEASACKTPVFGYRVPGLIDSVQENINGFLVDFGNKQELTNILTQYFKSSETEQQAVQAKACCLAKNYDWKRIAQEFELLIFNTLAEFSG
ncbi:MAG: glycosyltransferase family 4 protein [Brevinemataceae bacterium]